MNIEVANRLVELRKENNLSQEALAEKLGVSRQAVSKWERAEASPDTDNLIALAKLYQISLDKLLQIENGETAEEISGENAENNEVTVWKGEVEETADGQSTDNGTYTEQEAYTENDGSAGMGSGAYTGESGSTGAGENDENRKEEYVHIGLGGIHVKDKDDEVHIGWDGIHVNENGGDKVDVDKNGVYVNGEKKELKDWVHRPHFPMFLFIIILYLLIGCFANAWHPGWLLFLLIPIWESLVEAIRKKSAMYFAYPVLATLFFFLTGIFRGYWHPGWVWFVTIPLYYALVNYFEGRRADDEE